jgi:hypothetical protein
VYWLPRAYHHWSCSQQACHGVNHANRWCLQLLSAEARPLHALLLNLLFPAAWPTVLNADQNGMHGEVYTSNILAAADLVVAVVV